MLVENLDVGSVRDELALLLERNVLRLKQVREAPLLGHDDLLTTREPEKFMYVIRSYKIRFGGKIHM